MRPPSDVNVGLDSHQEYYSYLRTINHSEIGVMFTNLANELGHHLVWIIWGKEMVTMDISPYIDGSRMGNHITIYYQYANR